MGGPPILPCLAPRPDSILRKIFDCHPTAAPLPPTHPPVRALAQRRAMETAAAAAEEGSLVSPRRRQRRECKERKKADDPDAFRLEHNAQERERKQRRKEEMQLATAAAAQATLYGAVPAVSMQQGLASGVADTLRKFPLATAIPCGATPTFAVLPELPQTVRLRAAANVSAQKPLVQIAANAAAAAAAAVLRSAIDGGIDGGINSDTLAALVAGFSQEVKELLPPRAGYAASESAVLTLAPSTALLNDLVGDERINAIRALQLTRDDAKKMLEAGQNIKDYFVRINVGNRELSYRPSQARPRTRTDTCTSDSRAGGTQSPHGTRWTAGETQRALPRRCARRCHTLNDPAYIPQVDSHALDGQLQVRLADDLNGSHFFQTKAKYVSNSLFTSSEIKAIEMAIESDTRFNLALPKVKAMLGTKAAHGMSAGGGGTKGLPYQVLRDMIQQHPNLRGRIQEIVSRKDMGEEQKMAAIEQITREKM